MDSAREIFERINSARACSDARTARKRYLDACDSMRGLGQAVRVKIDGSSVPQLVAIEDIPADTAISAFAPDVVVYLNRDEQFSCDFRAKECRLPEKSLQTAVSHFSLPLLGFEPLVAIASDPSAPISSVKPHLAAGFVADVTDESPYIDLFSEHDEEGNLAWADENIPALARAAGAHLDLISSRSNACVGCASGKPVVLLATRDITAGEAIISGRRPLYWLGGDKKLANAICEQLLSDAASQGEPKNSAAQRELRIQLGLAAR